MDNNIKLQSILSESSEDLTKNLYLYNEIYNFYENKDLSINQINLLILDIENKLSQQKSFIDNLSNFFVSLMIAIFTCFLTTYSANFFNNNEPPNITIGSILGILLGLVYVYFTILKPQAKDNEENQYKKLVYLITIEALNNLKTKDK